MPSSIPHQPQAPYKTAQRKNFSSKESFPHRTPGPRRTRPRRKAVFPAPACPRTTQPQLCPNPFSPALHPPALAPNGGPREAAPQERKARCGMPAEQPRKAEARPGHTHHHLFEDALQLRFHGHHGDRHRPTGRAGPGRTGPSARWTRRRRAPFPPEVPSLRRSRSSGGVGWARNGGRFCVAERVVVGCWL